MSEREGLADTNQGCGYWEWFLAEQDRVRAMGADAPRQCVDGGKCHHDCGTGPCWRESNAAPLTGAGKTWDEARAKATRRTP